MSGADYRTAQDGADYRTAQDGADYRTGVRLQQCLR
jgi:hypothetical protein